jgi:hypothetical protein
MRAHAAGNDARRMRAFTCGVCRQLVFFENDRCLRCRSELAFDWDERELLARPAGPRCANREVIGCNGLARAEGELCRACALTRTRPNDADTDGLVAWADVERAKRRLVFELLELGLPVDGGLTFDLLSSAHEPVVTGHADGVVTIDLAESDDAHRERMRVEMGERYRTVLGHLRHEVGHYYVPVLTAGDPDALARVRALMGDERADYQAALDRHYENGPPADWAEAHVSAYATMHPAEDWAETFSHVLHIHDVLQTAGSYGLRVEGPAGRPDLHAHPIDADAGRLAAVLDDWLGLTYALNAIDRSLGHDDFYPFVLPPPVIEKLVLVDGLIGAAGTA